MERKLYEKWLNYALYLLTIKPRTIYEIETKLKEKQVDSEVSRLVLDFLVENKLVDDITFAQNYIEANQARYGVYRMKSYLKRKGISDRDLDQAFQTIEFELDPLQSAKDLLDRKIRTLSIDWESVDSDYAYRSKLYGKLARFLAGRGFSSDIVKLVVRERLSHEFFDES